MQKNLKYFFVHYSQKRFYPLNTGLLGKLQQQNINSFKYRVQPVPPVEKNVRQGYNEFRKLLPF